MISNSFPSTTFTNRFLFPTQISFQFFPLVSILIQLLTFISFSCFFLLTFNNHSSEKKERKKRKESLLCQFYSRLFRFVKTKEIFPEKKRKVHTQICFFYLVESGKKGERRSHVQVFFLHDWTYIYYFLKKEKKTIKRTNDL